MKLPFTHLHCHSYFSMMHGTMSLEQLIQTASQFGMKRLALTDINGLYGWVEFVQICQYHGIQPICGVDLQANDHHAVLLAKDELGYRRLCHITSEMHLKESFSLKRTLTKNRDHLAILTRDLNLLDHLTKETGRNDLYVEIIPGKENLSRLQWAKHHQILPVASNDVYLRKPEDLPLYRLLRAIDENSKLSRLSTSSELSPQRFFCQQSWIENALSYAPEAIENATWLAETLYQNWKLGSVIFPPFAKLGESEAYFQLRWKCLQGAKRRYVKLTRHIRQRLEYELALIRHKGFCHYFLLVEDIVRQAPRTCGRGSVAASLVSYCLGITHVDPIRHHLMFERFLNPGRQDPPDADIDFPWDERDQILDYIFKKHGPYRAAMVANHVRFQPRAAFREVSKVGGIAEEAIEKNSDRLFRFPPKQIPRPWDRIMRWSQMLTDFPRHLSVHCGGIVIVPTDLRNHVPLQRAPKGVNIIQWDKDQTEDFGLVKLDILGNRSLAVIRDAQQSVLQNTGQKIDFEKTDPTQDRTTQEMLRQGQTMGVFYVESPAMRQLQQKADRGDYQHLVIHSSLIRPASNRWINEYVRRLHGKTYQPLHPVLEEILKESYGVMVYQEDVTKVAMALASFDSTSGDGLRKALSKKRPERQLTAYRKQFIEGARRQGISHQTIEKIWEMILSFAGYSFCKPHSASYALVSYQSAYLRRHFPAEFMAAVLSNGGGFYSTFAYLSEARRLGLKILPPDINESEIHYTGRNKTLRVGFMQIKGIQRRSLEKLIKIRQSQPFKSLEDLLWRVPLAQHETNLLIRSGCLDTISHELNRPQLLWKMVQWYHGIELFRGQKLKQASKKQASLFDSNKSKVCLGKIQKHPSYLENLEGSWIPPIEDYSQQHKLRDEIECFGIPIQQHPLKLYELQLQKKAHIRSHQMKQYVGQKVTMAGWWITGKLVRTQQGQTMEFMSFEDLTGIYETVFFPKSYQKLAAQLNSQQAFWLTGHISQELGAISLHVEQLESIFSKRTIF